MTQGEILRRLFEIDGRFIAQVCKGVGIKNTYASRLFKFDEIAKGMQSRFTLYWGLPADFFDNPDFEPLESGKIDIRKNAEAGVQSAGVQEPAAPYEAGLAKSDLLLEIERGNKLIQDQTHLIGRLSAQVAYLTDENARLRAENEQLKKG